MTAKADSSNARYSRWRAFAYAVPFILLGMICGTYAVSEDFYLTYVISPHEREGQAIEILTFACAATAGILLLIATVGIWKLQAGLKPFMHRAFGIVGIIALATIFFAGEEVNWGQTYIGWEVSGQFLEATNSLESNLHNRDDLPVSIKTLAQGFLIIMFAGLPFCWMRFRDKFPDGWEPAIPDGPVISCILVAYLWKFVKNIYRAIVPEEEQIQSNLYMSFLEQINEHKEMLIAVALLMYAIYRFVAIRKLRRNKLTGAASQPG